MKVTNAVPLGLLALVLCFGPTPRSQAAADAFLKIAGIPGESTDGTHREWIEVTSFQWGVGRGITTPTGGSDTNRATVKELTITKQTDKASPMVFLACASGVNIPEVELVLRYLGGTNQVEFLKIKLENVIVSNVKSGGASSGETLPLEDVSFNYAKIRIEYQEVDQNKAPSGPAVIATWDVVANQSY